MNSISGLPLLFGCFMLAGCELDGRSRPFAPSDGGAVDHSDLSPTSSADAGDACGTYAAYKAHSSGIVQSPCEYDVSKILSLGGEVRVQIASPTIRMEFPDGTLFLGPTDGETFTATRTQMFPFTDGCMWRATETLEGKIDTRATCNLQAKYGYREQPVTMGPCGTPCTIDADLIIERDHIIR